MKSAYVDYFINTIILKKKLFKALIIKLNKTQIKLYDIHTEHMAF